jgi:trk system potassium uptake protein
VNLRFDLFIVGWLLLLLAVFLCVPLGAAVLFDEPVVPFVGAALLAAGGGWGLIRRVRPETRTVYARDGFLVVGGTWLVVSVLAAVPYILAGNLGPVDAFFEAVSGFTTTGSTVVENTAELSSALLLWRAMTQWLGGMGIILFTIAILPLLGIGGMQLFKAEVPGPVTDKVRPRLAATARSLWAIYVGFTAVEWVALQLAGMGAFEALCHSFTTLATGGFSTRNASVGEFASPAVEWIIVFFMLMAGINFVLHYRLLAGRFKSVLRDTELRYFLGVVVGGTVLTALFLHGQGRALSDTVRKAAFQTVSILTTTGYVTADFEVWPTVTLVVLMVLMVLGGMSGSTGGGIKSLRALLAVRSLRTVLHRLIHPNAVIPVKYGGTVVRETVLSGVWGFLTAYVLIAAIATGVVAAHGYDMVTSTSSALTAIGNVGPGLGEIGAYDNFAHFPATVKLVLALCMLLGRLEIFTLLVLATRAFWRR